MNITIVGTGYVGLVTGACFAEMGNKVLCVDINAEKIKGLKQGKIPIYEPGLEELVRRNAERGYLKFSTNIQEGLKDGSCDIIFSAVGTPQSEDGSADLQYVLKVAEEVGKYAYTGEYDGDNSKELIFVTKSTVPVGTAKKVKTVIERETIKRNMKQPIHIASNPEFLKEGSAIKDFMFPNRIVIGCEDAYTEDKLRKLYRPFALSNAGKIVVTNIESAEMIKYASNAMLATRISFMNSIANLCDKVGANVNEVRKGMGYDERIGQKFLYAGCGYGGSCFPKDVRALIKTGTENGVAMELLKAVDSTNDHQKFRLFHKLNALKSNDLKGLNIAILGLAFKPETDDIREAPSIYLTKILKSSGVNQISVYDPIAMDNFKKIYGNDVRYATDEYDALVNADAAILLTEWNCFRMLDWDKAKELMRGEIVLDGRNIFDRQTLVEKGFYYEGIGC